MRCVKGGVRGRYVGSEVRKESTGIRKFWDV